MQIMYTGKDTIFVDAYNMGKSHALNIVKSIVRKEAEKLEDDSLKAHYEHLIEIIEEDLNV
jgi:hypothetical protein